LAALLFLGLLHHVLLQDKLQEAQIQAAEDMLATFYNLLPELYGNEHYTLNAHLLIHLLKYVPIQPLDLRALMDM